MLLEVVRERIQVKHYSPQTGGLYTHWISRYVDSCRNNSSRDMAEPEV
jgi:hypothetical protein